jgi:pyruvate,orthophosphate dikinase
VAVFKKIVRDQAGRDFPGDPIEQLRLATEAVFRSWNGKRAIDYRNAAKIPHDLGTAVNIVTMVFGNMGDDSATGVAMTRSGNTGDPRNILVVRKGSTAESASLISRESLQEIRYFEEIARNEPDFVRPIVLIQAESKDREVTVEVGVSAS